MYVPEVHLIQTKGFSSILDLFNPLIINNLQVTQTNFMFFVFFRKCGEKIERGLMK